MRVRIFHNSQYVATLIQPGYVFDILGDLQGTEGTIVYVDDTHYAWDPSASNHVNNKWTQLAPDDPRVRPGGTSLWSRAVEAERKR